MMSFEPNIESRKEEKADINNARSAAIIASSTTDSGYFLNEIVYLASVEKPVERGIQQTRRQSGKD